MYCLWCMEQLTAEFGWSNFFSLVKPIALCKKCESHLLILTGNRCKKCSREIDELICSDCLWWNKWKKGDPLIHNYSIFDYNPFMKELIAKWKYRGDYVLGEIFKPYMLSRFTEQFGDLSKEKAVAVPVPLSEERLYERGFNQAEILASYLPIEKLDILSRKHAEKQSKKTRYERIFRDNPFLIKKELKRTVVLVDDIYTTGSTLRQAAIVLKENGCPKVYAITLIRG